MPHALARRRCGIGQPQERHAVQPEIGIDQRHAFFQRDFGVGRVKLPGGMLRVANCEPGVAHEIDIRGHALYFLGLEIDGVFGDQQRRVRMAFQLHVAVNIVERAVPRLNIELGVISFEVLILEIELYVPASHGLVRRAVVLHVVRP